jgi:NADPH:quinone reductase-like Zn-dependent oxidoreductase
MDTARKIRLTRQFADFALPRFADGRLVPIVESVFDWRDAARAHERMESNLNVGKIVLQVTG